jgi:outer membrane protein OmpA-like peptidoglycan-associated protein
MKARATLSVFLMSVAVALASPASANYFANPRTGLNLNVGSAPNPVPRERILLPAQSPPIVAQASPPAPPPPVQPVPQVRPAPPLAPSPPPPVQRFVVFFDFNVAELSSEAQLIVDQAVDAVRQQQAAHIIIVGHTDTVGSRAYNQRLSERRALAVKNQMVRAGLDEEQITVIGRNFADPLVPTGPGVREPQNRRAVIDLGGSIS